MQLVPEAVLKPDSFDFPRNCTIGVHLASRQVYINERTSAEAPILGVLQDRNDALLNLGIDLINRLRMATHHPSRPQLPEIDIGCTSPGALSGLHLTSIIWKQAAFRIWIAHNQFINDHVHSFASRHFPGKFPLLANLRPICQARQARHVRQDPCNPSDRSVLVLPNNRGSAGRLGQLHQHRRTAATFQRPRVGLLAWTARYSLLLRNYSRHGILGTRNPVLRPL